jgi:hypothetical protein
VGAPCADPAALAVSQCPQVPRATEDLQSYLDGFVTEMAANAGAPTDAMRDALRKAVLDFVGGPDADCCQSVLSVFAWLQKMIEGATMSAEAAIVALDSTSAARHHAALRLFTEVLWHPVSRHRVRGPDGQARILQACAALVKALVAVLAHAATPHCYETLDVFHAAVPCTQVLLQLSYDAACWPCLLDARALCAITAAAAAVAEVLKPPKCRPPMFQRNLQHCDMLSHAITMVTNMAEAPGELDLSLYKASKVLLAAVRKYHWGLEDLPLSAFKCCTSVFARVLQLDRVVEQELDQETNFMAYFEILGNFVFHPWGQSRVVVGAAQALVRMMLDAAASKHAVALVDLIVFAFTEELSFGQSVRFEVLDVLTDGFAQVLPAIEQFEAFTVRRFSRILVWLARPSNDSRFETCRRKAQSLARFVPTMALLMRKYSDNFLVIAQCCEVLYPLGHEYGAFVDFKLLAPAASAIADVIVAVGCNLVGPAAASLRVDHDMSSFLWSCVRVLQSLATLEETNGFTEPSVTLPAVQPLCHLALQLVHERKHDVEYIVGFFQVLTRRRESHDALRSSSQGCLDGLTRLLDIVHAVPRVEEYGLMVSYIVTCLSRVYEFVECFSAEDVACMSAALRVLQHGNLVNIGPAAFRAKVQLAQTQHHRWTDLRKSWVGAVGQHQAQLHDTLRAAELELQAALAEEEDEDADADVVTAPAHKLARRA